MLRVLLFVTTLIVSSLPTSKVMANETMTASWYGPGMKLHTMPDGRRVALMANGDVFNMDDPTVVAHKTLPFGTELKLTNPNNGREILVTVQDRGPFVAGRELDLSRGAAKKIGMITAGEAELIVERLN